MDEWATILILGRRVHHYQCVVGEGSAKITAEAGIGRSGRNIESTIGKFAMQPCLNLFVDVSL
jgi:hypothetical protein